MSKFIRLIKIIFIFAIHRVWVLKNPKQITDIKIANKFTKTLELLGPAFIKFGQVLSTRPDIVGEVLASSLGKLQDKLPEFSYIEAKKAIEKEFGKNIEVIFKQFDKKPIAAASIAQVHKAILYNDIVVAVKILRPNIKKTIKQDIKLFYFFAKLLEKFVVKSRRLKPVQVVDIFAETITTELDLRFEAASADLMRENFLYDDSVIIPKIEWEFTGENILTMDWVEAIPIYDKEKLIAAGINLKDLAAKLAISFFNQAYRDGFFHADMHPGNLLVTKEGKIALIDFGIMGFLNNQDKIYVAEILRGFLNKDYDHVAQIHFDAGYIPSDQSKEKFSLVLRSIGEPIVGLAVNQISIGKLLAQLFQVTAKFKMETQPQLLLLQKTMVIIEGVGSMLDKDVNMWELAKPWMEEWAKENLGLQARLQDHISAIGDIFSDISEIVKKFKD
jgi:ubiquinone biosynthesis protein